MSEENRKHNLNPYEARVEYLALKEAVDSKLRAGHSIRAVYDELRKGGHLRMCYSSFCGYVRRSGSRKEHLGVAHELLH